MKNWKSSLFGLLKGAALVYAGTQMPTPELQYSFIAAGLGAIGLGVVTKDKNVTGGTVQQ